VLVAMHRDLVPLRRRRHEPRRDSGPPGSRAGRTSPSISACGAFPARWGVPKGSGPSSKVNATPPGAPYPHSRGSKLSRTGPIELNTGTVWAPSATPDATAAPRRRFLAATGLREVTRAQSADILSGQCHHNCRPTVCRSVAASSATRRPTVRRCASVALRGTPLHFVGMTVAQSSDRVRSDLRGAGATGGIDGALLAGIPAQTSVLTMRHRGLGCAAHGGPRPRR